MELFAGFNRRQLRQVVALSTRVHKPAGAVVAREGTLAQELLVVISGTAIATIDGTPVAELAGGAQIGTSVLGVPVRHGTTVTTATPTDILVFSMADVRHLVQQNPVVRARLEGIKAPSAVTEPERPVGHSAPSLGDLVGA